MGVDETMSKVSCEDESKWRDPKNWVGDKRYSNESNKGDSFEGVFVEKLWLRYLALEHDFRMATGAVDPCDKDEFNLAFDALQALQKMLEEVLAKKLEEEDYLKLLAIHNSLEQANRYMVTLIPNDKILSQIQRTIFDLQNSNIPHKAQWIDALTQCQKAQYLFSLGLDFAGELDNYQMSSQLSEQFQSHQSPLSKKAHVQIGQAGSNWTIIDGSSKYNIYKENQALNVYAPIANPSLLDEVRRVIIDYDLAGQMNNELQVTRLNRLFDWGRWVLVILLVASVLATNSSPSSFTGWPAQALTARVWLDAPAWISAGYPAGISLLNALTIAILGAIGGFLSGLLQARRSHITIPEYRENKIKLNLKPLVGAITSLVLYILLSWQIVPGFTIQNTGSYFLVAFLAGFSERYFFDFLDIKPSEDQLSKPQDLAVSQPPST